MEGARPATPADVPQLAELNSMALAELAELRGGKVFVAREARSGDIDFTREDQVVIAGTIDDTPVGYAIAHTEELRDGTRLGVLTDLYVEPEARGVAVGEYLMNAVLEWCSTRGCAGVDSYALPGDRSTKNFFEGSGFTARLLVMHHKMPGHT